MLYPVICSWCCFVVKQKTAYEMRSSDWSSDVCSSDRELVEQLNGDLIENASSRDQIESSLAASQSAAVVTDSFKRQFTTGRRTWLDVMNAVREANQAELAAADAEDRKSTRLNSSH